MGDLLAALRRPTLRARLTVLASAAVALVLTVAGLVLVAVQRVQLLDALDDGLEQRAAEVVGVLEGAGGVGALPRFDDETDDDAYLAVLAVDGTPRLVTPPYAASSLVDLPVPGRGFVELRDDEFRVLTAVADAQGGLVVHVGASAGDVREAVAALAGTLVVGVPLVSGLLGVVVWWLVGRALAPVERIRRAAVDVDVTSLDRRVPEPTTDDEVGRLARTMNEMLDRLQRSIVAQQRFVADASHELRTPITRLRAQLEAPGHHDVVDLHSSLAHDAEELGLLVDDLLFLARADDPAIERRREPVDLDDIVLAEVARLRADLRDRQDLRVDASAVSGADVVGDGRSLARAVRNLLDNAARHAVSTVAVSLSRDDDEVRLVVADDGPGIRPEHQDVVFERFTRLDEARTRDEGGAGLGLAIAREVARHHGGDVRVLPTGPLVGAALELRLPG